VQNLGLGLLGFFDDAFPAVRGSTGLIVNLLFQIPTLLRFLSNLLQRSIHRGHPSRARKLQTALAASLGTWILEARPTRRLKLLLVAIIVTFAFFFKEITSKSVHASMRWILPSDVGAARGMPHNRSS